MTTYSCIKCSEQYQSEEAEAYYCPKCLEEKKAIALEIDKTIGARPRKPAKSSMELYDEQAVNVRGLKLMKIQL